jgi:SAM-dependent methyltransferase
MKNCTICGNDKFLDNKVLWPALISEWGLLPHEIDYINIQQGRSCTTCKRNYRAIALAGAIMSAYDYRGTLDGFCRDKDLQAMQVLEINTAGHLHDKLKTLTNHKLVEYPEFDMMNLELPDNEFDLIIHSDTLEHIPDHKLALRECARVLKPNGHCIFTIPIITGRLSRSRHGLKDSFHGNPECQEKDYIVHSEFGMDVWKSVIEAGFTSCKFFVHDYPSAIAIDAQK